MASNELVVDVIHSPWCFCEAPEESYKRELEKKWKIKIREFNMWEIEDDTLDLLPKHISETIRDLRDPNKDWQLQTEGGSMFFLNGKKLDLSPALKWPQIEKMLNESQRKET